MKQLIFSALTTLRQCTVIGLSFIDRNVLKRRNDLMVLCYHSIQKDNWFYSIDPQTLYDQVRALQSKGYTFISLPELVDIVKGKTKLSKPSVVITFDDGYKNILQTKDFFKKNNITPALFVLSDTHHANRDELKNNEIFLTSAEIRSLHKEGWTIGSHSGTHARLDLLSRSEIEKEVIASKKQLEQSLRLPIRYFAYPRGRYNDVVLSSLKKAGYLLGLTIDEGFITEKTNPLLIPRIGINRSHMIDEFLNLGSPSVMVFRKIMKKIVLRFI